MEQELAQLQSAIERARRGRVRWRCPRLLRSRIVSYVSKQREAGARVADVAEVLGVSTTSLDRWASEDQEKESSRGAFRAVKVVERGPDVTELVLIAPRGYRVEGLTVETTLWLLRGLQ